MCPDCVEHRNFAYLALYALRAADDARSHVDACLTCHANHECQTQLELLNREAELRHAASSPDDERVRHYIERLRLLDDILAITDTLAQAIPVLTDDASVLQLAAKLSDLLLRFRR